jgi:CO/xanthine dehydrogenase Mo-binding subunit
MSASTLGTAVPQVNARAKVLGRAQYSGDIQLPGMLHGKVLRSPWPHARIVRIDASAARALPGVKAVITGEDGPQVPWGVHKKERLTFARGVVRFAGEEVAAVAAVSDEIARDALDLIEVEYEELPPLLTPDEALAAGAPTIHPGRENNIAHDIRYERGDVDAAFAQAHLVHEATYTTHAQYPGYMEPMATVATVDPDGRLQVWTSTHSAHLVRGRLAAVLGLPVTQVRVIQATTGGGFGGKMIEDANNLIAGALALRTGRPVRVVNNRLEDFLAAPSSVPERITLRLGMDREGHIVAKDVRIIADCGAYSGLAPEVMHVSAMRSDNMHRNPNVRSHATMTYTHTPPHGAFRGFGGTQMQFALNSHIDVMARKLDLDPVHVHRINAIERGETSVHGWQIGSTGMQECLDQCVAEIGWNQKRSRAQTGVKRRGVGIAAAMHVSGNRTIGNWDGSTVMVKINEDGRAIVHSSEADVGQGAQTILCQAVAHELDIPLAHVHITLPDTDSSPWAIGTLASRVTIAGGHAAMRAGQAARDKLVAQAAMMLKVPAEELECAGGTVRVKADPARSLTLAELARNHIWRHGGEGIQVTGTWDARTEMFDKQTIMGNIAPAYSFAAQAVEVEVDTETGQVTLIDSFVSDDCGKAFNPLGVHGQSNGAAAQAIGWALYEQLKLEDGRIANGNFADYTMPTPDSIPMLRSGIVESMDPNGPYGAKGASETAILPGAAAIANAVFDAVGVRITDLPITPEKILAALRRREETRHA